MADLPENPDPHHDADHADSVGSAGSAGSVAGPTRFEHPHRAIQVDHSSLSSKLGPGLITGAADDDPSGIATYSQGGAQFGFQMLWTLFITWPLMVGI